MSFKDKILCNVTFATESMEIKEHKVILATCSSDFRDLFTKQMPLPIDNASSLNIKNSETKKGENSLF